ncbi:MAG: glycine cleavage system aminomethyltransferase GcvT [Clostridia bacterium]
MEKTPMNQAHKRLRAKMTDFGNWEMPVQYTSILEEHRAVRESCGMFDVSHMGEIVVRGKDALALLDLVLTNDIREARPGEVVYSPVCMPDGGCVDDVLVYVKGPEEFLVVVNSSGIKKDEMWLLEQGKDFQAQILDVSRDHAQLALQGPKAQKLLQQVTGFDLESLGFFKFAEEVEICGIPSLVSRTGYTGEDGFEVYLPADQGEILFVKLLELGFTPCGLGARDTLRFESALPLYGHELSLEITPVEAGLSVFVKPKGRTFLGKEVLLRQMETGTGRRLVGFEMTDRGVARNGHALFSPEGEEIGFCTSGSFCPSLNKNMGLGLVRREYAAKGKEIHVEIRNKRLKAVTVNKPFYDKKTRKREE